MTTKQRAFLKGEASKQDCVMQIGKDGINENVKKTLTDVIKARELIKINVLKNSDMDIKNLAHELASICAGEVISVIGNKIILYKQSKKNIYKIEL